MPFADCMEWSASKLHTGPQTAAFVTPFPKRRHDDAFPLENAEEEEISSSKKPRPCAPEILPRIQHLRSPRNEMMRKRHPVSDRDRKRKLATERALVQSYQNIGLLQATTLTKIGVKKAGLLRMALGPSHYDDPSDYLLALPIAQTPDLWDVSKVEEPETANAIEYAVLEMGQYRFDLASVAYELVEEVVEEEAAHMHWIHEVNRSVAADIDEYVHLNPKYQYMSVCQQARKIFELSRAKDDAFIRQWHETCKDIPFDALDEETLEAQVTMSIARAAHLNPLPSNITQNDVEEFVERVQRIGIEYHRAHNRKFLYLWQEKVKKARKLEKYRKEQQEQEEHEWQADLHTPRKKPEHAELQVMSPSQPEIGNGVLPTDSTDHGVLVFGTTPPLPAFGIDPLLFNWPRS